ncbi:MAG: HAD family hydrolase [Actinobacteria bacterium]|nr:HAD family hydrolase [Actinomycetota bacterium]
MHLPRPPKAVTFDCWSTLISDIDWDATTRQRCDALVSIGEQRGWDLDKERAIELIEASWQEHVQTWRKGKVFGSIGAARWVVARLVEDDHVTSQEADEIANELALQLEDATSRVGTKVVEGAVSAVQAVRDSGIATALICDTGFTPARHVRGFLGEHGIELDHYFFSDEVGVPKPDPRIFMAALDACGCSPEQAIHIGDLRSTDIAGARGVGMATIRFAGIHDDEWYPEEVSGEEADQVIKRWDELASVIGI